MRTILAAIALFLVTPAIAAEHTDADRYYSCLVGYGAVELVNGSDADAAFSSAVKACETEADAAADDDGGDIGSAVEGVEHAAQAALDKLAG
ncbi:MAG: hypothetical protein J0I48_12900 [Devosia sp.]|uniref:hypothetical protein n=1 Tax=Devosia sp. 66-22 TaxID=1895753 RepID=UPI0009296DC7|nr:hypothetical protein [Devosia sp. 66-22]MBN9347078.1 hypothetical protein [Devosia sp.]OJX50293.1 MAG: hypothetical protein BGO81_04215 [Devosia sp. 66-22]